MPFDTEKYLKLQSEKILDRVKLFGDKFIENNKNRCYLIINNKKSELIGEYKFNKKEKEIMIKLIVKKEKSFFFGDVYGITDMSYMFYECSSLELLPDISK